MLDLLQKLTGFSNINFQLQDIVHEFNSKFGDTWLKVNGQFEYVLNIQFGPTETNQEKPKLILVVHGKNISEDRIISLEAFKPEVGMYFLKSGSIVCFRKTAKKQFKKSLSIGENYYLTFINIEKQYQSMDVDSSSILKELVEDFALPKIGIISANRQLVMSKGKFLYQGEEIGTYSFSNPNLSTIINFKTNQLFEQEIQDFLQKETT